MVFGGRLCWLKRGQLVGKGITEEISKAVKALLIVMHVVLNENAVIPQLLAGVGINKGAVWGACGKLFYHFVIGIAVIKRFTIFLVNGIDSAHQIDLNVGEIRTGVRHHALCKGNGLLVGVAKIPNIAPAAVNQNLGSKRTYNAVVRVELVLRAAAAYTAVV